jgi:hypothetical protein
MNLTSVDSINWPGVASLLVLYFAGYVTRVVIEQIKPIWKTHKELRRTQDSAAMRDTPPNLRTKMKIASAILAAERREEKERDVKN